MATPSPLTPDVDLSAPPTPASPDSQTPNLERTGEAIDRTRNRSIEATVLTVLALLYTMYFARTFLIPIVFALLLNFLLSPVVRTLGRIKLKPPVAGLIIVLLLVAGTSEAVYQLAGPAQRWAAIAPQSFKKAQVKLRGIILPMQQVSKNVEQAADAVAVGLQELAAVHEERDRDHV